MDMKSDSDFRQHPLLSIIIATFNAEHDIAKALDSIFSQSFTNFQLVIMDAMSSDGTISIINKSCDGDKRLTLVQSKDKGIYDAMNKGVGYAAGDWLYFMGADDTLANNRVLDAVSAYLVSENDVVYGDSYWMPEQVKEEGEWLPAILIKRNINHQRIFYRKTLFANYGFYNIEYLYANWIVNIRLFCNKAVNKKYVKLDVANYNSGGFSSNRGDELFWKNWDGIILNNFRPLLSKKEVYGSLNIYCRYLIDRGEFKSAFKIMLKNFKHTYSIGFINLVLAYFLQTRLRPKIS